MKLVVMDMSRFSRWKRITLRWQVRKYGARILHNPNVPKGGAYLIDPEAQEQRLREDLANYNPFSGR